MIEPSDLRPGDLMFGPIGGFVPGVLPVGIGQLLLAPRRDLLSWRRWWKVRHCGVITSGADAGGQTGTFMGPWLVQAMPSGAEEIYLSEERHWTPEHVYLRLAYGDVAHPRDAAEAAAHYVGVPYNFRTYAVLAARGLRLPFPDYVYRRWISNRREMMCSQLVDQSLADAGLHVFEDGRLPQDVVPAELFRALMARPGTTYVIPGMAAWAPAEMWSTHRR